MYVMHDGRAYESKRAIASVYNVDYSSLRYWKNDVLMDFPDVVCYVLAKQSSNLDLEISTLEGRLLLAENVKVQIALQELMGNSNSISNLVFRSCRYLGLDNCSLKGIKRFIDNLNSKLLMLKKGRELLHLYGDIDN